MKLIHTSDLHLFSPLTARLTPAEARTRKRELIKSFRLMIDEAKSLGAEGIIIAGDLFDNERVGIKNLDSIMGIIENAPEITFFYLPGNHEKSTLIKSGIRTPGNLRIFGTDWSYFQLGNVTLAGCSSITAGMLDTLKLNEADINILILHGSLCDTTEAPDKISSAEIARLPVDYVALGHYHSYSALHLSDRTIAAYCGTPEGRGFDEIGDKGYIVLDIDEGAVTPKFVRRAQRYLHRVKIDISGAMREIEIENRVAHGISLIPSTDLVRVVLCGEHEPGVRRDTDSLTERFSRSFFYLEVKDESRLRISADEYKNDKSLKGEFIRLVLAREELTEEEKADIIECGIRALAGEAI
jgi:DNA repair exonuclease SbcCD nuclease subunit